jgi:hypothetical protein
MPPSIPDPESLKRDPKALKDAHGKYGEYLQEAGLPFEEDELDDDSDVADPSPALEAEE